LKAARRTSQITSRSKLEIQHGLFSINGCGSAAFLLEIVELGLGDLAWDGSGQVSLLRVRNIYLFFNFSRC